MALFRIRAGSTTSQEDISCHYQSAMPQKPCGRGDAGRNGTLIIPGIEPFPARWNGVEDLLWIDKQCPLVHSSLHKVRAAIYFATWTYGIACAPLGAQQSANRMIGAPAAWYSRSRQVKTMICRCCAAF